MSVRGISIVSCVFIHPAIHITIIEPDLSDADKAVEVLLNLSRSGRGAATLISQRILIRILGRIISQHRVQAQSAVTGVLVPHTVIRPTVGGLRLVLLTLREAGACACGE